MTEIFNINIPQNWEFVHTKICKYFNDKQMTFTYKYNKKNDIAEYNCDGFTICAIRIEVLYDNEYDIELKVYNRGDDDGLVLKYCNDLKNILLNQTACLPGESNFDDLM